MLLFTYKLIFVRTFRPAFMSLSDDVEASRYKNTLYDEIAEVYRSSDDVLNLIKANAFCQQTPFDLAQNFPRTSQIIGYHDNNRYNNKRMIVFFIAPEVCPETTNFNDTNSTYIDLESSKLYPPSSSNFFSVNSDVKNVIRYEEIARDSLIIKLAVYAHVFQRNTALFKI